MKKAIPVLTLGALILTSGLAYAKGDKNLACYEGERNPLAPAEISQFEFLLGSFRSDLFTWDQNTGDWAVEPLNVALWEGEYILNGMGIADYWYTADPAEAPETNRGVNTRIYNPATGEWSMTWNTWGDNPQTTILTAKMIDGVLTMWQTIPEPEQKRVSEFVIHSDDHWTRFTYLEANGQRSPFFKIESYRNPCEG